MQREYRSKPTSQSQRSQFISMWLHGKSARTIARDTGVSPATVCRWINRWRQEGNVDNHKPKRNIYCVVSKRRQHLEGNYFDGFERFISMEEAFWRLTLLKGMASVLLVDGNDKLGLHYSKEAWTSKRPARALFY